ncbi:unnamed protein product [Clonostachys chloroleuca]|uniref:Zn(2)-C6 fungal-type domain-containing protein n=1 Tax=Clonostachys chloroleuca TaxID=1926264 RepID=A0AA35QEN3_9HYPO|nr:unnamed protein product [Clonostachys chloroleuca]
MQTATATSTVKPLDPCTSQLIWSPSAPPFRHQKCDLERPCSNCRKSDVECVRNYSVRFRHGLNPSIQPRRAQDASRRSEFQFAHDQPWVRTNRTLSFVDETNDVINLLDSGTGTSNFDSIDSPPDLMQVTETGSLDSSQPRSPSAPSKEHRSGTDKLDADLPSPIAASGGPPSKKKRTLSHSALTPWSGAPRSDPIHARTSSRGSHYSQSIPEAGSPFSLFSNSPVITQQLLLGLHRELDTQTFPSPQVSSIHSPLGDCHAKVIDGIYLETPNWPLEDPVEAMLFQNYVHDLAPLFDLCDSDRHFATVVPRRAALCPPLMNAILAASAKRLRRVSNFDSYIGDKYHQNCLKTLIPALSSLAAVMDENLLTTIVILRFMEELDVPCRSTEMTSESHLVGTRVFIAAQEKMSDFSGLRRAAFLVALRQEIHMAFIQGRVVHPNFDLDMISRLVVPDSTGCDYANLIILHCASCIRYCYGSEEQSIATWEELRERQDRIWIERPWIFHPMHVNENSGVFPEVVYLNDAIVTGMLHYYLVEVLLAAHNPKTPRLGPGQAKSFRETNEHIKKSVLTICGIAESNDRTQASYAYVCLAITMAGDRFTDPEHQDAIRNILVKADTRFAWPTGPIQRHLLEGWGRELSPDLVSEQPQVETNDVQQHVELAESIASAIAMLHD